MNSFNGLSYLCNKDAKKLKNLIKYILQKVLGLHNYLFLFAQYVILKLPYDKNEKDFLKFIDLIDDGGHVLDIGANIGVMTYYFAKRLPETAVHSFEPVPDNVKVLFRVKSKFRLYNVKIHTYALGEKIGKAKMIMPELKKVYFHGLSHIQQDEKESNGYLYEVDVKKLDELTEFEKVKVNAIKIDVEGYELEVLEGAKSLINKNRPILYCELWENENRKKSMEFISKLNYKILVNQKKTLKEFVGQRGYQNFFFIPLERCENLKL